MVATSRAAQLSIVPLKPLARFATIPRGGLPLSNSLASADQLNNRQCVDQEAEYKTQCDDETRR
jgi:hypothetical protein